MKLRVIFLYLVFVFLALLRKHVVCTMSYSRITVTLNLACTLYICEKIQHIKTRTEA